MIGELFDPSADFDIKETCKPHWSQSGAVVFVTMRTADSIPKTTLQLWEREKRDWLLRHGLSGKPWRLLVEKLNEQDRHLFQQTFNRKRERSLDECLGECRLRREYSREIVRKSLLHFDAQRYRMGDFVLMPNHIHFLCAFANSDMMLEQFDSWQHFTAAQINRLDGRKGHFWQGDPFDHLVRSPEQYDYLRRYIADNPIKARLPSTDFTLRIGP